MTGEKMIVDNETALSEEPVKRKAIDVEEENENKESKKIKINSQDTETHKDETKDEQVNDVDTGKKAAEQKKEHKESTVEMEELESKESDRERETSEMTITTTNGKKDDIENMINVVVGEDKDGISKTLLKENNQRLERENALFKSALTCPICHGFFIKPHTISCGHSFCGLCLKSAVRTNIEESNVRGCPICRTEIETVPSFSYSLESQFEIILKGMEDLEEREELTKKAKEAQQFFTHFEWETLFPVQTMARKHYIYDNGDKIYRCVTCLGEIANGHCVMCDKFFPDILDSTTKGNNEDLDGDEEDLDDYSEEDGDSDDCSFIDDDDVEVIENPNSRQTIIIDSDDDSDEDMDDEQHHEDNSEDDANTSKTKANDNPTTSEKVQPAKAIEQFEIFDDEDDEIEGLACGCDATCLDDCSCSDGDCDCSKK